MEQQKRVNKSNIKEYSYNATSYDEYFTDRYKSKWDLNKRILNELLNCNGVKLTPFDKQLAFVSPDNFKMPPQGYKTFKLFLTPIQAFNLLYHEFDLILANKSRPLSIVPRLQQIRMCFHDKLYFYLRLIELLRLEKDEQLAFIASEIEEDYNRIFLLGFGTFNYAKKTANETIDLYKTILYAIESIEERIDFLFQFKHFNYPLHNDPQIDLFLRQNWLAAEIEYHYDLIKNGIKTLPPKEIEGLKDLIDTVNSDISEYIKDDESLCQIQQDENVSDQENDLVISTIEDWLYEFKEKMTGHDYSLLLDSLTQYYKHGSFPVLSKSIKVNGINKKLLGWHINMIHKAIGSGRLNKDILLFAKQNISIFNNVQFDENDILNSNLYKYFTTKTH